MSQHSSKNYVSIPELAKALGISRIAAYKRVKKGQIKGEKVGRNFAIAVDKKDYITIPQLAKVLGISRIAVYKQVKKGQLPADKVGRNHLIPIKFLREKYADEIVKKIEEAIDDKKEKN